MRVIERSGKYIIVNFVGNVLFEGDDATEVVQWAIDNYGGKLVVRTGKFMVLPDGKHIRVAIEDVGGENNGIRMEN